ncbi:MAG: hypothetical protein QOJ76_2993 [Acidobacteriota bacterium]|nr:hypothetical protein [Acidobacteriota bacterium]
MTKTLNAERGTLNDELNGNSSSLPSSSFRLHPSFRGVRR